MENFLFITTDFAPVFVLIYLLIGVIYSSFKSIINRANNQYLFASTSVEVLSGWATILGDTFFWLPIEVYNHTRGA